MGTRDAKGRPDARTADKEQEGMRDPDRIADPLDHGTPPDPDRPTDEVWSGNTLREPGPGD